MKLMKRGALVGASLEKARDIASIKLRDWKEDEHKGEKLLDAVVLISAIPQPTRR